MTGAMPGNWHTPCNASGAGSLPAPEEPTMHPDWPPKILLAMLAVIAVCALTLASAYGWVQLPKIHAAATFHMSIAL